jgi:GTPase SAR1 family protein
LSIALKNDNSVKIRLQFWDSPSDVQALREASFAGLTGALIAFDLSRASTFHNLNQWFDALKHFADIPHVHAIFLVGMKADLNAEVSEAEALELAEKWSIELGKPIPYVTVSSQSPSRGSISPANLLQRVTIEIASKMIAEPEDAAGFIAKVIVLGDLAVGKTSLISVLSGKGFQSAYMMTIGADFTLIDATLPLEDMKRAPKDHISARRRIAVDKIADEEVAEEKAILEPLARKPSAVASLAKEKRKKRAVLEEKKTEREKYAPPPLPSPAPKPSPKPVERQESPPKPSAPSPPLRAPSGPPAGAPGGAPPPAPAPAPPPPPAESMPKAKKEVKKEIDVAEKEVAAPQVQPSDDLDSFQATMGEEIDDMEAEEAEYEEPSEVATSANLKPEPAIEPSPEALSEPSEPTRFSKDCKVSYYDIMNPEKFYELLVHISDIPLDVQAAVTSLLTGERRTEVKEHVEVITEEIPLVTVRPIFPGCLITPSEAEVDFRETDKRLTFFVTPLVKGNISNARIELYLHNKELIAAIPTSTKVVDPRIARVIAAMGFAVGLGPKAVEYGFDVDFNENLVKAMPFLDDVFGSIDFLLFLELSLLSFFLLLAAGLFIKYRPRSKEQEAKL